MNYSGNFIQQEIDRVEKKIEETRLLLEDDDLGKVAVEELAALGKQRDELQSHLHSAVPDAGDGGRESENFNVAILEVRGAVGGDEGKLWAEDLLRMYTRYANLVGYKVSQLDEGVVRISGKEAYMRLKYETGVHRVQRVPTTEASGRIHTSTASVVVLPEVPETEIIIKPDELEWDFSRAGGHGGQNVNKVSTAVRLTHRPSGIVISCRMERSQEQNRKVALSLLRSRLWEIEEEKKQSLELTQRLSIGRSMRAEKIRTYNYPQNRVTDHRVGKSWHELDRILEGNIRDVLEFVGNGSDESSEANLI